MLKILYMGGITKIMSSLELYSKIACEVTILILANNSFDETSVRKLCAVLHEFSNLQQLFLNNNPIGSKGLVLLGGFVDQTTVLKELSLTNCSVEFLPRAFVSAVSKLTTCSLEENLLIPWPAAEVLRRSENAHDIHQLFYQPIDNVSRDSWVSIQEYLCHRCTEDGLKMFLSLIQFSGNGSNFCTSDCARLWIMIVGIPFEMETLYEVIEGFIELNVYAWSILAFCADDYGREAIMLSVGATQQFLSSRCFFMGLYDIPDGTQYEYKSATCTVYIVDRVENNKRTRVALKFMKNAIEFQREQASRSIFLASSCTQARQSDDFVIDVIADYDIMNGNLKDALTKRRWLVDYDNPCLLVMPAADRNLRNIMDNERITNPAIIKDMFGQTLACVKFLHKNGYIHGDLKPRNIVRILRRLKLIDFDASAQIGKQYAWTKHSSAYLPPEAVRLSLVVKCDDLDVAKNASSLTQCTIFFKVTLPIDIPIGCTLVIVLDQVYLTTVHHAMLDTAIDLSSHASIDNYVIALTVHTYLAAGAHSLTIVATFQGNIPAVDSTNATIQLVISSMFNQMAHSQLLKNFTSSIRIPMVQHASGNTVPHALCSCDNFVPTTIRSVDRSIPIGCLGLCGVAHISHDMWALGVILYRFCARQSLFIEDDEDNIKDGSVSGHLLELAQWTEDIKEMRLQSIDDTVTRALISKLLEKHPWKRPRSIDDVLLVPFNEIDVIRLKLEQAVPQKASHSSNLVGCVKDLSTGKFKDAAYGLRTYLKVASNWDEQAACTLQGMQDEVDVIKDCPSCAQIQADVLQRLGLNEAAPTMKLALALFDLKLNHRSAAAFNVVQTLRSEISKAGGWHYGMSNSILWPDDSVTVDCGTFSKIFSQPMCEACKAYDLDYSKIASDLHYIVYEDAVEKKEWNGIRDHGRAGYRLKDFMALPQASMAMLTEAELIAMRFYTSHSFNSINIAMRDTCRKVSHPLPGMVTNIQRGLKKLRALGSDNLMSKRVIVLWRGMSSMQIPQQFEIEGGTELAPMSTTADVSVAISYAVKKDVNSALLFRIVTRNNLERGADVQWLSMFPDESETLFPPLTFLQRTRTQFQEIYHNGVTVTVVELSATLA
jgi:serine/threonine protein kinase